MLLLLSKTALVRASGALISLITTFLVARHAGPELVGTYQFILTFFLSLAVIGKFGLDSVVVREMVYNNEADWLDRAGDSASLYLVSVLISSLLVSLLIFVALNLVVLVDSGHSLLRAILPFSGFSVPLSFLIVCASVLKAARQPALATFFEAVFWQAGFLCLIASLGFLQVGPLNSLVLYFGVSAFVAAAMAFLVVKRRVAAACGVQRIRLGRVWSALRAGYSCLVVDVLNFFQSSLGVIVLAILATRYELGIFTVAARLVMIFPLMLGVINTVFAPRMAASYKAGGKVSLNEVVPAATRYIYYVGVPLFAALYVFPAEALGVFGDEFQSGVWVLRILLLSQLVNILCGPVGQVLIIINEVRVLQRATVCSVVAGVTAGLALTPAYGSVGAAWAMFIALSGQNIIAYVYVVYCRGISVVRTKK